MPHQRFQGFDSRMECDFQALSLKLTQQDFLTYQKCYFRISSKQKNLGKTKKIIKIVSEYRPNNFSFNQ